jgi:hypothetical protein
LRIRHRGSSFESAEAAGGIANEPPPAAQNNYDRWWIERSAFSVTAI